MAPRRDRARRTSAAIAGKPQSGMVVATPAGPLERDSTAPNKDTMTAQHHATTVQAPSALLLASKDSFMPSIAEGRKQSRRAATKMYSGVSPSKILSNSTSRTDSSDMTMTTVAPTSVPTEDPPSGSLEPPLKRPRFESEARAPPCPVERSPTQRISLPTSPQRQAGNIAGLLHDETLEISLTSPRRSPSTTFKMLSPKQVTTTSGLSLQAQNSILPVTSLVDPSGSPIANSNDHVRPPQHTAHIPAPQSDGGPPHLSTSQQPYNMQSNLLRSHGTQLPAYPAPMTQPQSEPWVSFKSEHVGHRPQHDGRITGKAPPYPPLHVQPNQFSRQPQDQHSFLTGLSHSVPKNTTGPPTYPSFVTQPAHSPTSTDVASSQPLISITNTGTRQLHTTLTAESARHPNLQPPSHPNAFALQSDAIFRASSSTATDSSTSDLESQSFGASQTTPPSSAGSLSSETQSKDARHGLSAYPHLVRPPQVFQHGQDAVQRTLSERSYLELDSEPGQGTMGSASDYLDDSTFVTKVLAHIDHQRKMKTQTFGRRQAARIHEVLSRAQPPNHTEALFLSGIEAARYLQPNRFFSGIIITRDQQPQPLQSTIEFLNEYYDDSAEVYIQNPSVQASETKSARPQKVNIGKVKERFLQDRKLQKKNQPWNCLELATHVEDGLRPPFLAGEDCRLLTKLKLPSAEDKAGRRGYDPGWKEVEKWTLLAQAGALTEPHQDSHGYNTYITVNQGVIGFGWLANPNAEERAQWRESPPTFIGGRWRYVILRPGQTVYFPSGTVHFVFRHASTGDTLAFGGHVLRCSQIVRWIKTLMEEQADPDVTNEDLTVSAPAYLDRVEKFVRQALKDGKMDIWGGKGSIEEFLALKKQFEKNKG